MPKKIRMSAMLLVSLSLFLFFCLPTFSTSYATTGSTSITPALITSKLGDCGCIAYVSLKIICNQCEFTGAFTSNSGALTKPEFSTASCIFTKSPSTHRVSVTFCKSGMTITSGEPDYCCGLLNTPGACAAFTAWCGHWNFAIKAKLGKGAYLQESFTIYYYNSQNVLSHYVAWTSSKVTTVHAMVGNSYKFTCFQTDC